MRKCLILAVLIVGTNGFGDFAWELAPAAIPHGVEFQGGVARNSAIAHALPLATRFALPTVRALNPNRNSIFEWHGDQGPLKSRSVKIVFDQAEVQHPHFKNHSDDDHTFYWNWLSLDEK